MSQILNANHDKEIIKFLQTLGLESVVRDELIERITKHRGWPKSLDEVRGKVDEAFGRVLHYDELLK